MNMPLDCHTFYQEDASAARLAEISWHLRTASGRSSGHLGNVSRRSSSRLGSALGRISGRLGPSPGSRTVNPGDIDIDMTELRKEVRKKDEDK